MQEKPVFAEISENFSADCTDLPGIAAIRDASTRPVYSWSFDDIGIASGLFFKEILTFFDEKDKKNAFFEEIKQKKAEKTGKKGEFSVFSGKGGGILERQPPVKAAPRQAAEEFFSFLQKNGFLPQGGNSDDGRLSANSGCASAGFPPPGGLPGRSSSGWPTKS